MLSDYTGGPASNLGNVIMFAKETINMVVIYTNVVRYKRDKPKRLREMVEARRLPDKRLHISGVHYVH